MKVILLLSLLVGSNHIFVTTCNIEEGFYTIKEYEKRIVKVNSCRYEETPILGSGWGPKFRYVASFDGEDLDRVKRELYSKHLRMIPARCKVLGTGDVRIIRSKTGSCNHSGENEVIASFGVEYKCHLY